MMRNNEPTLPRVRAGRNLAAIAESARLSATLRNIESTAFGEKYVLVEHIATGGMAEIYRAQYAGIEGFAKELVIKMLREEFAARPDIVAMFLDEARVAATLTHNNVVHAYDLGEIDGDFFIAMELLKGEELVNVMRRCHRNGRLLPRELAIGIVMQSCEGLHYVHTHADEGGQSLGLVHRDINPTNVHVGYDGICKILDFGIAATRASALAQQGQIAGKISYMAPEQLEGLPLDHRADIFPLGVMLYEMCLGRRLFRMPKGRALSATRPREVPPPTFIDPAFPPALEAIIMKALEVDPGDRYENGDHMFRDLEGFLHETGDRYSPRNISALMLELFGEGAPANVAYRDDEYSDLVGSTLDFAAFESVAPTSNEGESPPDWVPKSGPSKPNDSDDRRRGLTIGSLEELVSRDYLPQVEVRERDRRRPSGRGSAATDTRRSRREGEGRTPTPSRPHPASSVPRRGALSSGSPSIIERDAAGGWGRTFGHGVMSEQSKKGAVAWGWIIGLVGVFVLAYFLVSLLTSK